MNILIVGLGAIGSIYATKFKDAGCSLKVLVDEKRFNRYVENGIIFNDRKYDFEYILPEETSYKADLIIIAVKSAGLKEIIPELKNFVYKKTIILSLLNGISSEKIIHKSYFQTKILKSYYVGHASVRDGNRITYDGIGKLVFEGEEELEKVFEEAKIDYEVPEDIDSSMWQKFIINIGVNQTTAILRKPYSCFRKKKARSIAISLMQEGVEIAKKIGIKGYENFIDNTMAFIDDMPDECKTSMMQDVERGFPTEVDIFAGEVCRLGKKYGIKTPENEKVYEILKSL